MTDVQKQQYCEQCKNDYAAELQRTNQSQRDHYTTSMPQIFRQLQVTDMYGALPIIL